MSSRSGNLLNGIHGLGKLRLGLMSYYDASLSGNVVVIGRLDVGIVFMESS